MSETINPIARMNPVTLDWMPRFIRMISNLPPAYGHLPIKPRSATSLVSQLAGIQAK
jgi:hypothetical protein